MFPEKEIVPVFAAKYSSTTPAALLCAAWDLSERDGEPRDPSSTPSITQGEETTPSLLLFDYTLLAPMSHGAVRGRVLLSRVFPHTWQSGALWSRGTEPCSSWQEGLPA